MEEIKLKFRKGAVLYDSNKDVLDFEGKKISGEFLRTCQENISNKSPLEFIELNNIKVPLNHSVRFQRTDSGRIGYVHVTEYLEIKQVQTEAVEKTLKAIYGLVEATCGVPGNEGVIIPCKALTELTPEAILENKV